MQYSQVKLLRKNTVAIQFDFYLKKENYIVLYTLMHGQYTFGYTYVHEIYGGAVLLVLLLPL